MQEIVVLALFLGVLGVFAENKTLKYYNHDLCGRLTSYKSFKMTAPDGQTGHITVGAPWAVQIRIGRGPDHAAVLCGGTLITNKHVLTAAHCFRKKFHEQEKAGGGIINRFCEKTSRMSDSHILNNTTIIVGSVCTKIYPDLSCTHNEMLGKNVSITRISMGDFFPGNCENGSDIAILELSEEVDKVEAANHVCLPFIDHLHVKEEINVTGYGWGSDPAKAYDTEPYPLLQTLTLETVTIVECNESWGASVPVDSICTREEEDRNMCTGDSGGGLTYLDPKTQRQNLLGIVSFGTDCRKLLLGATPKSQINTKITNHEKFIRDFVNN